MRKSRLTALAAGVKTPSDARALRLTATAWVTIVAMAVLLTGLIAPVRAQAAPDPALGTVISWAGNQSRVTIALDECGDIGVGTRGTCVASLQTWLNLFDDARLVVDGDFDSATQQAVVNYQRARGIDPLGVVRNQTRAALAADYNQRTNLADARFPDASRPHIVFDMGRITSTVYLSRIQSLEIGDALSRGASVAAAVTAVCGVGTLVPSAGAPAVICAALAGYSAYQLDKVASTVQDTAGSCIALKVGSNLRGIGGLIAARNPVNCQVAAL